MKTSATNKRLRTLLVGVRDKTLIPNPHFQRRLVWSNHHKIAFLKTVLDGLPFPEIFIAAGQVNPQTGDGTELIVDGQQRVTTLYEYFTGSGELILRSDIPAYAELDSSAQIAFLEYEVVVRDLGPLSENETRQIFHRINSTNYALNAMEVNNSRFDGELKQFAEALASSRFFEENNIFTALDGRRMNDVRFCLTLVITLMSGYFDRDAEHETYLEKYNDDFSEKEDISGGLAKVFTFVEACGFSRSERVWQKADLLNVLVELYTALVIDNLELDPGRVVQTLRDFYSEVEAVTHISDPSPEAAEYFRRVRAGINDRISRITRGSIVADLLHKTTGLTISE